MLYYLQNCLQIKSVPTSSSSMVLWICYTPIYHSSASDTICNMLIGYSIFQVSHDPPSSNDIGLHTIGILITLNSWFSTWKRCNLISVCCIQISMNYTKMQCIPTLIHPMFLCLTDVNANSNFCDVLFLHDCILYN